MRLLASEECTFSEILDALRLNLAKSYLRRKSAYVRSSVAFGLCRSQRIFSRIQTLDWQNIEATTSASVAEVLCASACRPDAPYRRGG